MAYLALLAAACYTMPAVAFNVPPPCTTPCASRCTPTPTACCHVSFGSLRGASRPACSAVVVGCRDSMTEDDDRSFGYDVLGDTLPRKDVLAHLAQACCAHSEPNPREAKAVDRVLKRLKKKSGAMGLLVEFRRDEALVAHDLSQLSLACRELGAAAVVVDVEVEQGFQDLQSFVDEQTMVRKAVRALISCGL